MRRSSAAGVDAIEFSDFGPNPDADMLEAGRRYAAGKGIDSIIGLGGGSSLDCAKGINFLLTQGGAIHDFQGYGKAMKPMLPMIGVPTTAGTGSEAQSYAIISDPRTHRKMACGDPKAAFRAVILDPRLTLTQPPSVTAAAGYDAIAHAVESFVCTTRNARSQERSLEAWRLLEANYERVLTAPDDLEARAAMQLGAFHAGTAIELSMLGATHACANPRDRAIRHDARRRHRDSAAARRPLERERGRIDVRRTVCDVVSRQCATPTAALAGGSPNWPQRHLPRTLARSRRVEGRSASARKRSSGAVDRHVQPASFRRQGRAGDLRMRVLIALLLVFALAL